MDIATLKMKLKKKGKETVMDKILAKFLTDRRIRSMIYHTHVSMLGVKGKFNFDQKDFVKLWEIYPKQIYIN